MGYEKEGSWCVPKKQPANGFSCFATRNACEHSSSSLAALDVSADQSQKSEAQNETATSQAAGQCFKAHDGTCSLQLGVIDRKDCFHTQKACERSLQSECYKAHDGSCSLQLGVIDRSGCFPTESACRRSLPACYQNEGGSCIKMHTAPNGNSCFATLQECETCYEKEGSWCVPKKQPANGFSCFA